VGNIFYFAGQNKMARNMEIDSTSQDQDKQMLLSAIEKLQKDKQQLLVDLRRMTERLAKG